MCILGIAWYWWPLIAWCYIFIGCVFFLIDKKIFEDNDRVGDSPSLLLFWPAALLCFVFALPIVVILKYL